MTRRYLLLLDYDGTLTPLKKHPKLARLSPARRAFLRRLAGRPGIKLAIISGRQLSDLRSMVGLPRLIYAGNHGLEIRAGEKHWEHPAAKKFSPLLKKIMSALERALPQRGILIEDKGLTLSVHYRRLPAGSFPAFKNDFLRALQPWRRRIKVTHGKKVFEVRPPVAWNKGRAVEWIIRELKLGGYLPVYLGDDLTDEDAFRALRRRGLTVLVGKSRRTAAACRLDNVAAVYKFLRDLPALLTDAPIGSINCHKWD
jgi:trehalose 6-phosphate phosphatase